MLVAAEPVSAGKDRLVSFPAGPIWVSVAHSHLPAILLGNVSSGSCPVAQKEEKAPLSEISWPMSGDHAIAVAAGVNLHRQLRPSCVH